MTHRKKQALTPIDRPSKTRLSISVIFFILWSGWSLIVGCEEPEGGEPILFMSAGSEVDATGELGAGGVITAGGGSEMPEAGEADGMESMGASDIESLMISMTVRAINPLSNQGVSGVTVTSGQETQVTDMNGAATLNVEARAPYAVTLSAEMTAPHVLYGISGELPFTQVTFMSTDALTAQVLGLLGLQPDPTTGIVVIGLDTPNLSPAVGASAELSLSYESAFTLGAVGPVRGQSVVEGGGGFVSFAHVTPGETEVRITPPEDQRCLVFPGEVEDPLSLSVIAGQVSVMAFTCRPAPWSSLVASLLSDFYLLLH
jgi:hypothetical protein